jgi:hypothetical protein
VRLIMAVAAVGLFLIGYQWGNQYQRANDAPPRIQGVLLNPPITVPDVSLQGPRGDFAREMLDGHWSLLAFGSPGSALGHRGVARLMAVNNRLADRPDLRDQLRLLLVSADDLPAVARDFERLSPNLHVLSTNRAELEQLQRALGATTAAGAEAGDQPPALFLVDPTSRVVVLFPGSQPAQQIADDLATLAERPIDFAKTPDPIDA